MPKTISHWEEFLIILYPIIKPTGQTEMSLSWAPKILDSAWQISSFGKYVKNSTAQKQSWYCSCLIHKSLYSSVRVQSCALDSQVLHFEARQHSMDQDLTSTSSASAEAVQCTARINYGV